MRSCTRMVALASVIVGYTDGPGSARPNDQQTRSQRPTSGSASTPAHSAEADSTAKLPRCTATRARAAIAQRLPFRLAHRGEALPTPGRHAPV